MTVGKGVVGKTDGAGQISEILRERFNPGVIDSVLQDFGEVFALETRGPKYGHAFDGIRHVATESRGADDHGRRFPR